MICPYCNKEAPWVNNKEVYGRQYGKSYMCYYCKDCDAYVGCHENSKRPLGIMANKELRSWRQKAHLAIDHWWKVYGKKRSVVYGKLATHFDKEYVHIGESNIEECKKIIEVAPNLF